MSGSERQQVTVIVATRNRVEELERMLSSLAHQILCDASLEVIVVDNGSTDDTPCLLQREWSGLKIRALHEPVAGKSRALNRALDVASGTLLAFTDDDISASPQWLRDLINASLRYPCSDIFCGPIVPVFPSDTPDWLRMHFSADAIFARFQPQEFEGPLPLHVYPFGANFAIRFAALGNERFRLDLGPSAENGAIFSEDVEFVARFNSDQKPIIFVPSANVQHHIAAERIESPWLNERAFHLGRARIAFRGNPIYKPKYLQRPMNRRAQVSDSEAALLFELAGLLNYHCGQMSELRRHGENRYDRVLAQMLAKLDIDSHIDLLSHSARTFYTSLSHT